MIQDLAYEAWGLSTSSHLIQISTTRRDRSLTERWSGLNKSR